MYLTQWNELWNSSTFLKVIHFENNFCFESVYYFIPKTKRQSELVKMSYLFLPTFLDEEFKNNFSLAWNQIFIKSNIKKKNKKQKMVHFYYGIIILLILNKINLKVKTLKFNALSSKSTPRVINWGISIFT